MFLPIDQAANSKRFINESPLVGGKVLKEVGQDNDLFVVINSVI